MKSCDVLLTERLPVGEKPDPDTSTISSDDTQRANWDNKLEFAFALIGYAVGLGNFLRFPYICMRNGGGAFLIPYFIFLFTCGVPLFFMELAIGQYCRASPLTVWNKIAPLFKGLGYGMVAISGIVCIYYNVILGWTLYYLFMSFTTSALPWANCNNEWNTPACRDSWENSTAPGDQLTNFTRRNGTTPAEEYWHRSVLQISDGIDEPGSVRWQLVLCLLIAWIVVFVCLSRGIKTAGKVVYVTATLPYLLLVVLLIRGLTLPGAMDGIRYYLTPDFERLLHFEVWVEACGQIFYSLGPAYGGLITFASYNKRNNNCYRDALIFPCINCGTSFLAGFVVFSILGFMSHRSQVPISEVITSGPGLAFVVYPEALAMLPLAPVWSGVFFAMLFVIGLDTQFGMFETMTSGFTDEFASTVGRHKTLFTAAMSCLFFLLGLPIVTQGGVYVFQILDWYCATFSLVVISLLECVVVAWIYGVDRLYNDVRTMIGYTPCRLWKGAWLYVTPLILLVVLLSTMVTFSRPRYGNYVYPTWAIVVGWLTAMISLVPIPVVAAMKLYNAPGPAMKRIRDTIRPEEKTRSTCKQEADY